MIICNEEFVFLELNLSLDLMLVLIGTATGVVSLIIYIIYFHRETPNIKIIDEMMTLQYKDAKFISNLEYKISNTGNKDTSLYRINVIFGPDVEVFDKEVIPLPAHSLIKGPSNTEGNNYLYFEFPKIVDFEESGPKEYFIAREKLSIIVFHTHGLIKKEYLIPLKDDWEKQRLWKGDHLIFTPEPT